MRPPWRIRSVLFVAGVATLAGCSAAPQYDRPVTPVQIIDVRRQPTGRTVRFAAAVEPATRLDLAFRVGGYVTEIATIGGRQIQDGDHVTAGARLAEVRTADYDERVTQARAQLAEAEAGRPAAVAALARAEALFAARSLTKPEVDQARAAAEAIAARIAGAAGRIREAELARGDATLRAPISGVVLRRAVDVGTLVAPGTIGFVVADVRRVKVVLAVPDTVLEQFSRGRVVRVRSEALPDRQFEGRITNLSPSADPRSRLFEVEVTVPNQDEALRPGMVTQVIPNEKADEPDALMLPLAAIVRPPGQSDRYAVFVIDDRGGAPTARLREVSLGALVRNAVIVVAGVAEGERVIVGGASLVSDGERVNPTR